MIATFLIKNKILLQAALLGALVAGAAGYGAGRVHEARKSAGQLAEYKEQAAQKTVKIVEKQVEVVTKTEVVYRDRIQKIYLKGEQIETQIPVYIKPADELVFAVNTGFVRVLDAAWAGQAPGPAADADREPAGVPLGEIATAQVENATVCHAWREQALGWRRFYADQQQAINGAPGEWAKNLAPEEEVEVD